MAFAPHSSILIASWLSAMLYGVVVYEIWEYLYWDPASADSRVRKWLLLCCTASSSIGMATQLANVYYVRQSHIDITQCHYSCPKLPADGYFLG